MLIPKEENLIYSPGKSGNYRRSSPIISRRVLISSFSAHFKRGKPGLCPGSSVAALPCKVTFQIEPLKDELRTIAVRISDSGILGIPAAGKEKNSRRACPFSCYYSWFWDVLRTFGCNVANARYACRTDEGLHTGVHPCQLTTCLPVRVVLGIACCTRISNASAFSHIPGKIQVLSSF